MSNFQILFFCIGEDEKLDEMLQYIDMVYEDCVSCAIIKNHPVTLVYYFEDTPYPDFDSDEEIDQDYLWDSVADIAWF